HLHLGRQCLFWIHSLKPSELIYRPCLLKASGLLPTAVRSRRGSWIGLFFSGLGGLPGLLLSVFSSRGFPKDGPSGSFCPACSLFQLSSVSFGLQHSGFLPLMHRIEEQTSQAYRMNKPCLACSIRFPSVWFSHSSV